MRYFFQDVFWDATGGTVASGTISVYQAGTTTVASLYSAQAGGTAVNSVTSDSEGVFSFWVDDADYIGEYKLVLSKTNYQTATYDNVAIQVVDLSGVQTLSNKTLTSATLTAPTINNGVLASPTLTSAVLNTSVSGTAVDNTATLGTSATKLATQGATLHYVNRIAKVSAQKMIFSQVFN